MNGTNNLNFDINSMLIIIGVLLILYFLKIIMNNQQSLAKKICSKGETLDNNTLISNNEIEVQNNKQGITEGSAKISGDIDDEIIAVIMSAVSEYSNIPLNSLKIKSIKKLQ